MACQIVAIQVGLLLGWKRDCGIDLVGRLGQEEVEAFLLDLQGPPW